MKNTVSFSPIKFEVNLISRKSISQITWFPHSGFGDLLFE